MTTKEIIVTSLIHLAIPLIGLISYLDIITQTRRDKIENAPTISIFTIFTTYWLFFLVLLTFIFLEWSPIAGIATWYLVLAAPILMASIAVSNYKKMSVSKYHYWTFISSAFCVVLFIIVLALFLLTFYLSG